MNAIRPQSDLSQLYSRDYKLGGSTISKATKPNERDQIFSFLNQLRESDKRDRENGKVNINSLVVSVFSGITDAIELTLNELERRILDGAEMDNDDISKLLETHSGLRNKLCLNIQELFKDDKDLFDFMGVGTGEEERQGASKLIQAAEEKAYEWERVVFDTCASQVLTYYEIIDSMRGVSQEEEFRRSLHRSLQNLFIGYGEDVMTGVIEELLNLNENFNAMKAPYYLKKNKNGGFRQRFRAGKLMAKKDNGETRETYEEMIGLAMEQTREVLNGSVEELIKDNRTHVLAVSGFTGKMEFVERSYSDLQAMLHYIASSRLFAGAGLRYIKDVETLFTAHGKLLDSNPDRYDLREAAKAIKVLRLDVDRLASLVIANGDNTPLSAAACEVLIMFLDEFKKEIDIRLSNLDISSDTGTQIISDGPALIVDPNDNKQTIEVDDLPLLSITPEDRNVVIKVTGIKASSQSAFIERVTRFFSDRGLSIEDDATDNRSIAISISLSGDEEIRADQERHISDAVGRLKAKYGDDSVERYSYQRLAMIGDLVQDHRVRLEMMKILTDFGYAPEMLSSVPNPKDFALHVSYVGEGKPPMSPQVILHKYYIERDTDFYYAYIASRIMRNKGATHIPTTDKWGRPLTSVV